jgi:1-deoxy-D-xylulose-5-phosphate reductoisomerase
MASGAQPLDFKSMGALTFETPDRHRFPGFFLAWEALQAPFGATAVLNAANEVAVEAFLSQRLRFDHIAQVNAATLSQMTYSQPQGLDDLLALDAQARRVAAGFVLQLQGSC